MKISDFLNALSGVIPLATTGYAKDAVGLQVGYDKNTELRSGLIAYEVTESVIEEAINANTNLIIAYHPLIFPNINAVTDSSRTGSLLRKLIRNDIALYVVHTAFDTNPDFGTSKLMADALGLTDTQTLVPMSDLLEKIVVFAPVAEADSIREAMWNAGAGSVGNYDECSFSATGIGTFRGNESSNPSVGKPHQRESVNEVRIEMIVEKWKASKVVNAMIGAHSYEEVAYDRYPMLNTHPGYGMGSIGRWDVTKSLSETLERIKKTFKTSVLRHNGVSKDSYSRVAMVGGAGMEYYSSALRMGAEVYVTGDIRYHDYLRAAHDGVLLVDAGHAETERFVTSGMLKAVKAACNVVNLHTDDVLKLFRVSDEEKNVVHYY
ncbi:MAG: Nif3-like dinuclear metal center hexameric protein [bacterium]